MSNGRRTARRGRPALNGAAITVRMYNVGFGDAFLVRLPGPERPLRILFDCGSIGAAEGRPMDKVVTQIIKDCEDDDGHSRIDVVVATHRHRDHISGFANAAWDDVEVKEVWLPWTEDPDDADAARIRRAQRGMALGLAPTFAAASEDPALPEASRNRIKDLAEIVFNASVSVNDAAMVRLHEGFAGNARRRFLPEKPPVNATFETPTLPGVVVHAMGPSRSEAVIRDLEPPAGASYFSLGELNGDRQAEAPQPFRDDWTTERNDIGDLALAPDDEATLAAYGVDSDLAVAVALDKAINGTSLMLSLEIEGRVLLFPGDAQWGTWNEVLADERWKKLLKRAEFYKIGHHGSHNATPRTFVDERLGEGVLAMASVKPKSNWPEIPRKPLFQALLEHDAHIARSDQSNQAPREFFSAQGQEWIETKIPLD